MPEDSKKSQHKAKHDPKEQRKPRQGRQPAGDKKQKDRTEKKAEEPKVAEPPKPVAEDPGPEFYKSLKRETDEILKITEEASAKYKKKEIQSNWTKYEMPVESYDDIDEQENMGADFEKLIAAPLSVGGHFQFKHEKSWDISTAPSLYDKYFDINMDNLAIALSTIPFCERNSIDQSIFSQTDVLSMNNRSTRFKQKYYNDKSYTNAELEAEEHILSSLKDKGDDTGNKDVVTEINKKRTISESKDIVFEEPKISDIKQIHKTHVIQKTKAENVESHIDNEDESKNALDNKIEEIIEFKVNKDLEMKDPLPVNTIDELDVILTNTEDVTRLVQKETPEVIKLDHIEIETVKTDIRPSNELPEAAKVDSADKNDPVIESAEDLEKWLDAYLDS